MGITLYDFQINNLRKITNCWIDGWQIDEERLVELYDEIEFYRSRFNNVINYEELIESEEWDGFEFKNGFVEQNVWAISNGAPEIVQMFRGNVNGEKLIDGVLEMLELANSIEGDIDRILVPALEALKYMPNKVSIATEILHKSIPDKYPIKNYKSNWGLAFILEPKDLVIYTRKLSYIAFRNYIDNLYIELLKIFEEYDLYIEEYYKYWIIDRIFWYMVDEKYSEIIKIYNSRYKEYY
ncbi:hypothetical protein [Schnuerera ultunensis]|uniref:hypothetical protein n=1 Tax=Schnuerera ultunensis TaxID=45497 RepID=UPI00041338D3|nr:hypothetical protein [Schnuerera ultunensis]